MHCLEGRVTSTACDGATAAEAYTRTCLSWVATIVPYKLSRLLRILRLFPNLALAGHHL